MTKFILPLFLFLSSNPAFSQIKKVEKILSPGFLKNTSYEKYRFNETDPRIIVLPSDTYQGDTSGLAFQNEFVNFRYYFPQYRDEIIHYRQRMDTLENGKPLLILTPIDTAIAPLSLTRYIQQKPVTVSDYLEFQHWVRDSTAREILYLKEPDDEKALKMLHSEHLDEVEIGDREIDRNMFPLNWKYPLVYNESALNTLSELYLKPEERFGGKPEIDQRKLTYHFYALSRIPISKTEKSQSNYENRMRFFVEYNIPTLVDTYSWMKYAPIPSFEFAPPDDQDVWSVISQRYLELFPDAPITGLTGMQAKAYCHWKKQQLQREMDRAGLPYIVEISLPTVKDLNLVRSAESKFTLPAFNPTENWRITVDEYREFVKAVQDSILNEKLYAAIFHTKDAAKGLKLPKTVTKFLSQVNSKPYEDTVFRDRYFPLSYNRSLQKKYKVIVDSIKQTKAYSILAYQHIYMSAWERSFTGKLEPLDDKVLEVRYEDTIPYLGGKNLNLGMVNNREQSSGVRSHDYLGQFFVLDEISIVPGIDLSTQKKGDLVKGITYEQALAYYHWKHPITKSGSKSGWQQFVFPNEEQFERIQKGEKITIPAIQVDYPSPIFRYVVHLIPDETD